MAIIYKCKGVTVGGTAVAKVAAFAYQPNQQVYVSPVTAGDSGPGEHVAGQFGCQVIITGFDAAALEALCNQAAADVVCTYIGDAGADKTITIKSVIFDSVGQRSIPAESNRPAGPYEVRGSADVQVASVTTLYGGLITHG